MKITTEMATDPFLKILSDVKILSIDVNTITVDLGEGVVMSGRPLAIVSEKVMRGGHVEGYCCMTLGEFAHAEGEFCEAIGDNSHAEGVSTTASGISSHAEGGNTTASGDVSHAEGVVTTASGEGSHAEGSECNAYSAYSHAEGKSTNVFGNGHSIISFNDTAKTITLKDTPSGLLVGSRITLEKVSIEDPLDSSIFIRDIVVTTITDTTLTLDTTETLTASFKYCYDDGFTKFGITSMAGHGEGINTIATHAAHSEGRVTRAIGLASHAEGSVTTALGLVSHAEGSDTIASGDFSHAEGVVTTASGYISHSEGSDTTASGAYSHAEGSDTTASGYISHAEGVFTTVSGVSSHAEGNSTIASGAGSHASGLLTIAQGFAQTVVGVANNAQGDLEATLPTATDLLFIVGNGTVDMQTHEVTRSNALTLDYAGNLWTAGSQTVTQFKLSALNTAPASATDTGVVGEIRVTADYIYVCVAENTWKRTALTTW